MLVNRSDFKTAILILFTKCNALIQSLHSNLSLCQHSESPQDFRLLDTSPNGGHDDALNRFDENSMPSNLYKRMKAALYIEDFSYIIEENLKEFEEAIPFIINPSKLSNYNSSQLEDLLSKFIEFVNTFKDDENTKNKKQISKLSYQFRTFFI